MARLIRGDESGHRAVVHPEGALDVEIAAHLYQMCCMDLDPGVTLAHLVCGPDGFAVKMCSRPGLEFPRLIAYEETTTVLRALAGPLTGDRGRRHLSILTGTFDRAGLQNCKLFGMSSRSFQEEQEKSQANYSALFCGSWNFWELDQNWDHDQLSFPFGSQLERYPLLTEKELRARMHEAGCPRIDGIKIISRSILTATGGSEWLVAPLLKALRYEPHRWMEMWEKTLRSLPREYSVIEQVRDRIETLSHRARRMLTSLLRYQFLKSDEKDVDAESLWLSGLAVHTGRQTGSMRLAGTVVEATLKERSLQNLFGPDAAATRSVALMPTVHPVNTAAYELVFRAENLLRNLLMLEFQSAKLDWDKMLEAVRIRDSNLLAEIIKRRAEHKQQLHLAKLDDSPAAILTTGELESLLTKYYDPYFKAYFRKKDSLTVLLERLRQTRDAVMHNYSLPYEVLGQLDAHLVELERALGARAAEAVDGQPG